MATPLSDRITLITRHPEAEQVKAIYDRRRATVTGLIDILSRVEERHHLTARANDDLTEKAPRWSEAAALGSVITHLGAALQVLGMTPAQVDAELRKVRP
jgi:hypothetical protein